MKNSTIVKLTAAFAILFLGYANSWGQEVSVPSSAYKQHGFNSADLDKSATSESKDSVTITSTMKYWVKPDANITPDGVFTWSVTNNPSTIASVGATTSNLASVTFNSTGVDTLKVFESSAVSCAGAPVKIPFEVIAKPTVTYGTSPAAVCNLVPDSVTVNLPVTLTTSVKDDSIRITYEISGANTVSAKELKLKKSATTFTIPKKTFTNFGENTITITLVSDRISRKSNVAGTISGTAFKFTINRTPVTGPIYHLPNM